MVTSFLQSLYYKITIRAGAPRPMPGTPRFAEHYRRIYIAVVGAYLLFTIYEADWDLQRTGDFYSNLGVLPNATEKEIKRRYRILSAALHPDKMGRGEYNAETYIRLQTAHATLTDEAKRFAYDRFGPDVLSWKDCVVVRDYIMKGATDLAGYYGMGAIMLYALPKLGFFSDGIYWRWMAFLALAVFEVHTITRPEYPPLIQYLVNPLLVHVANPTIGYWVPGAAHAPYIPFQAVAIARQVSLMLSIALNQVVPYLTADTSRGRVQMKKRGNEDEKAHQSLADLDKVLRAAGQEAGHMVQLEAAPFMNLEELRETLRLKMRQCLVEQAIRSEPMTKDAIHQQRQRIMRRRQDAPAGAQGNGARMRPTHSANENI